MLLNGKAPAEIPPELLSLKKEPVSNSMSAETGNQSLVASYKPYSLLIGQTVKVMAAIFS
jgi:hypothetical protein